MIERQLHVQALRHGRSLLALVLLEACAASSHRDVQTADARVTGRAGRTASERDETPVQDPSQVRRHLQTSVETLAVPPPAMRQRQIASALRNLGTSLKQLPEPDLRATSDVHVAAGKLEDLPVDSTDRTDALKEGLDVALRALLARDVRDERMSDYFNVVAKLGQTLETLDNDAPLLEQQPTVTAAFQAATDAVFLAADETPPFAKDSPPNVRAVGSVEAELTAASTAVLELGRADRPTQASAHALSSLADALAAVEGRCGPRSDLSRMRLQAERLRHAGPLSFDRANWLKEGLEIALDALDALGAPSGDTRVALFSKAARDAIDGLDEDRSLGFQRGALQDAFRSTLDALIAAAQAAAACPTATAVARTK